MYGNVYMNNHVISKSMNGNLYMNEILKYKIGSLSRAPDNINTT